MAGLRKWKFVCAFDNCTKVIVPSGLKQSHARDNSIWRDLWLYKFPEIGRTVPSAATDDPFWNNVKWKVETSALISSQTWVYILFFLSVEPDSKIFRVIRVRLGLLHLYKISGRWWSFCMSSWQDCQWDLVVGECLHVPFTRVCMWDKVYVQVFTQLLV